MPRREQVAEVLAAHTYIPSLARGVSRCACGVQFHGMPHDHRAHVTDVLMPLFDVARNEALEEAAAALYESDWFARRVRALKTDAPS
jgi:uncharacterized protein (DUF2336 family)